MITKMKEIVSKVYTEIVKVKKSESVLIICDKKTKKIAENFFEYGLEYGDHTLCLEIKETTSGLYRSRFFSTNARVLAKSILGSDKSILSISNSFTKD